MIKKYIKEQKGVTLISLVLAVMIILILTNMIVYNVKDNLSIQRLKELQDDIMNLRDKVSSYYTEYGAIPIIKNIEYTKIEKIEEAGVISDAVDVGKFYVLDLKLLDNVTLSYGSDYEKIVNGEVTTSEEINELEDLFIINEASNNIFYVKGVKIQNVYYYTDYTEADVDKGSVDLRYVDGIKIPEGFYYVAGDKNSGIVISSVKGDDLENTKRGNQFVWVPVENFEDFKRKDFGNQNISDSDFINTEKTDSKYYEKTADGVSAIDEVQKMYRSVKQNKGFYIARFEAGLSQEDEVVSKKDEEVYNLVKWGNATDETGGAVEIARSMYPRNSENSVVSTLCYGVQWDAIMRWISKDSNLSQYLKDSSSVGNYSNGTNPEKTGSNDNYQVKNIYDLAGNVGEWTMENYNKNNYSIRGGDFTKTDLIYKTMASRIGGTLDYTNKTTGFRVALYLKADASGSQIPTEYSRASTETTLFSTEFGRIDIVWLDKDNNIRETPEAPILAEGMTPVTWTEIEDDDGNIVSWIENASAQSTWYDYTGTSRDSKNSSIMWANAKNDKDGSYFVWIPRYAYRITYYENEVSTVPTGYYDGWGMWKADDASLIYSLDEGIETVVYNNTKYIVHPAFETNLDNGGWDKDISGFWVAKYEMSRENSTDGTTWTTQGTDDNGGGNIEISDATKIRVVSKPYNEDSQVSSWRNISIGNSYTNSLNYDTIKGSHLIKNSEWGAVAYLAHSQYRRNGIEISINNSSNYYTGVIEDEDNKINTYNTPAGALASTTGNVYGVYDMAGGAWERVAVWDTEAEDTNNYITNNGSSFATKAGTSTKYVTAYNNGTNSYCGGQTLYRVGKIGDATKEVNTGGAYSILDTNQYYNWFKDYPNVVNSNYPFSGRSGYFEDDIRAGIFASGHSHGDSDSGDSFRVVLIP